MKYFGCSLLGFLGVLKKKSSHRQSSPLPNEICRQFSIAEIKAATNNFNQGSIKAAGGFGYVYRGTVDYGTTVVAIKRYERRSSHAIRESHNEARLLCQLRHPHLVPLIGFCHEQNEMILVYEYMSRGSLSDHLYGKVSVPLAWKQRLQICIGAARGLHYLHTGTKHAVFHRDIRSSNILLDDEWSCKLRNFGLSKLGPLSMSKAPIVIEELQVEGTIGYMAPEYATHGELTDKSDVFSFGIVLFEVLCGRRAYKNHQSILEWASEVGREGTIYDIVDPYLKGRIAPECFEKYSEIACSCVHYKRDERPAMGEVEVMLELALELQKKADSEMEGINPHGEYGYEEASFGASVSYFDLLRHHHYYGFEYPSGPESDSDNS